MKPDYARIKIATPTAERKAVQNLLREFDLRTVCEMAGCPNKSECWNQKELTFILLGPFCTRSCGFCRIQTVKHQVGHTLDDREPEKVLEAARKLGLEFVVLTSTARDDLPLDGAEHFAKTIRLLKEDGFLVEALIPEFHYREDAWKLILDSNPDVIAHNVETVAPLYDSYRKRFSLNKSLNLLRWFRENGENMIVKSALIVGLGESREDLNAVFRSLAEIEIDILVIGQYLQPTRQNTPVTRYYSRAEFVELKNTATLAGIPYVQSEPLARSSYHSYDTYREFLALHRNIPV